MLSSKTKRVITATFKDRQAGYLFNVQYSTKGSFLAAVTRGNKKAEFVNAVDHLNVYVIKPSNLEEWKKG